MLGAFQAEGRFLRGNIHGHSTRSDGRLPPQEACARYREAGYDFVCLTDHFLEKYGFPITDTTGFRDDGFTTILGAEVHTPAMSNGTLWHIVAVGLPLDFTPTKADETGPALARRCADAGAFVALAHPEWNHLTLADALSIDAAHAIEVYNHTNALNDDRGNGAYMLDACLDAGRRLSAIAVDDSHWGDRLDAFGGWVMVKARHNDPSELVAALRAGRFYASQGPEIHAVARDGDMLHLETSQIVSAMLLGPRTKGVRRHSDGMARASLPLDKFAGTWCRAVVVDAFGRRAWTNPLWP